MPQAFGPAPCLRQMAWHRMGFYGFVHFTVNTFTDKEWGYGDESPAIFNPAQLDTDQWASVAKEAGMKGLILTAKHHDGFCLWPSRLTDHSVKNSPWRGGKGDVVGMLADSCRRFHLKLGIYLSPWDRNRADYGTPAYLDYYSAQLDELLQNYGQLFEIWFDGANGGDGYYGGARQKRTIDFANYYPFEKWWQRIRQLQPNAVIFSDAGPDVRWIGNEEGTAPDECWGRVDPQGYRVGDSDVQHVSQGQSHGTQWRPAEVDVSIRKGWFWHAIEEPHSLERLWRIYLHSIGRGCGLNLNLPPNRDGLIDQADVDRLRQWHRHLDRVFAMDIARGKPISADSQHPGGDTFAAFHLNDGRDDTCWAAHPDSRKACITLDLGRPTRFNLLGLREPLQFGQRISAFSVRSWQAGGWKTIGQGKTVGNLRLLELPDTTNQRVQICVDDALAEPLLSSVHLYDAPPL